MRTRNKMLMCAVCVGLTLVIIITGILDFAFADVAQTVCGVVVLICQLVLFVSFDPSASVSNTGSLIVNDTDEVYLVLNDDISELRKKSRVDLSVYLSHSS
nr:MAG TPA: hypothetical protein [Caudoviricetes sp.]